MGQIQYVTDDHNTITSVIVPIELWREIESERETAYLLKSDARNRREGISFDDIRKNLGI